MFLNITEGDGFVYMKTDRESVLSLSLHTNGLKLSANGQWSCNDTISQEASIACF